MRRVSRNPGRLILSGFLWAVGVTLIVAGLGTIGTSPIAALCFILLGLVCIPPVWEKLRSAKPRLFNRKLRALLAIGFFILAGATLPPSTEPAPASPVAQVAPTHDATPNAAPGSTTDKPQKLTRLSYTNNSYVLEGSGLANTEYIVKPSDSPNFTVTTNSSGTFSVTVPTSTQVFGSLALARDTNGAWPGGEQTYDTQHFVLQEANSTLQPASLAPITLGLSKTAPYGISGYYTPKKALLLKSGGTVLASTKVDGSGRYAFEQIALASNYTEIALYEKISTGWFSSKEEKVSDTKYLDKTQLSILKELPVTSREVVSSRPIAFTSREVQSSKYEKDTTQVTQQGVDGEQTTTYKVTFRGDQEIGRETLRSDVTQKPVEQITTIGTRVTVTPPARSQQPSAPQTQSGGRTGATCRDGSHSNATGRGACSHHGGVAEWLY